MWIGNQISFLVDSYLFLLQLVCSKCYNFCTVCWIQIGCCMLHSSFYHQLWKIFALHYTLQWVNGVIYSVTHTTQMMHDILYTMLNGLHGSFSSCCRDIVIVMYTPGPHNVIDECLSLTETWPVHNTIFRTNIDCSNNNVFSTIYILLQSVYNWYSCNNNHYQNFQCVYPLLLSKHTLITI